MEVRNNISIDGYIEIQDNTSGVVPPVAGSGKLYKKVGDSSLFWRGDIYSEELNVTSPSGSVFAYVTRTVLTLGSGTPQSLGDVSGKYTFYKSNNPKIYSSAVFTSGDTDIFIDVPYYDTLFSSVSGNIGTVNIFSEGTNLYIQNNYSSGIIFNYYREI